MMENVLKKDVQFFVNKDEYKLVLGDSLQILEYIRDESIDMIFADPPYFLSNDGITCKSGKMVLVNKGDWDKIDLQKEKNIDEIHNFNRTWIRACKKLLKPNGSIWISGTMHNIYSVGMALEQEEFKIINNITWQKTNPPPNLSCRCFTHSTETILWARKGDKKCKHFFNYKKMKELNDNKQMKDVWTGSTTKRSEKTDVKHPTQKPQYLLERIVLASTEEKNIILDPFCGSGTTGVEALKNGRNFIGIDNCKEYLEITQKRLEKALNDK